MQKQAWEHVAQAYAFAGNSLLAPMSQTSDVGFNPVLWDQMPTLDDADAQVAIARLKAFAETAQLNRAEFVQGASVEYAHLFIGPPSPACPPWETYYRREGVSNGFGAATFEMRDVLRQLGLEAAGSSNQFEDHAGIELLVLSELCQRMADADGACRAVEGNRCNGGWPEAEAGQTLNVGFVADFMRRHITSWLSRFAQTVAQERPDGYHALLLRYVACLAEVHLRLIADSSR